MDADNLAGLVIAILIGLYVLYCLFRAEDIE